MQGVLRKQMGFNGLIVTDATQMVGFTCSMDRAKAVPTAIEHGADMFLFTINQKEDVGYLLIFSADMNSSNSNLQIEKIYEENDAFFPLNLTVSNGGLESWLTPVKQKEEKNMHIAIVEDDPATRAQLAEYIQRYTRQYGTTFQVDTFADGDEIAENYRPVYDILFMDIEMKHLDGMETARRIRQLDGEVLIIFITNTAQYAINGYSVGATDYMLKPVPYFCFSQQLKKAVGQLQKRARFDLTVTAEDGMRRLNTAEIYYIESDGHTVHFYTENGDFSASGLLKNFEEKLAGRPFARCNNCYLVNLAQVAGIAQEIVKVGPHSLPVSRTKRRAFLDAMSDYIDSASAV